MESAAKVASGMTGKDFVAEDIYAVLVSLKLSRHSYNYREDNLLDAVAYIGALDNYIKENISMNNLLLDLTSTVVASFIKTAERGGCGCGCSSYESPKVANLGELAAAMLLDKEAVDALINNKDVVAMSFVGSTPIAKYIYENCAKNEKRVQALGGAKNHCVVMPDCDLDQAVNGLMGAAYGSAGERCMAQSVAVAVGGIGDKLVSSLAKKVEALKVGPGMDKKSEMGPLVTKDHLKKVKDYVDIGEKEGAKLIVDGRNLKLQGYENGYYIGGCLFDHVTKDMKIYKEEIFGPVLSIVRAKNFDEALKLVNDHEFGNGASIFTRDGDSGRTFSTKAKIGMIGINIPIPVPMAFHSFGGWKRSLFGDQHMHGPEGVRFYTKLKTITSRWPSGSRSNPEFVMPTMK